MKEKIRIEKKKGKVLAYFMGKRHAMIKTDMEEVKRELEEEGYTVEYIE